jgi:hypothetical protein
VSLVLVMGWMGWEPAPLRQPAFFLLCAGEIVQPVLAPCQLPAGARAANSL